MMVVTCGSSKRAATDLQSHGVTKNQIDSLTGIMNQAVEQGQIAGGSFLVAHKGEIVFREAFGYADIESKRAFTTEELLPIASVSKPFMASVMMVLVEQGKLSLDDPVEKYLPEFKGKKVEGSQSPARPMTIRHLLSHTAGFWGNQGITPEKMDLIRNFERPLSEAVKLIADYDLSYEPGTKWIYSGTGYCVLGRVAEVALGQSLEEIAQEALFRPLGTESHDLFTIERSTKNDSLMVSEKKENYKSKLLWLNSKTSASSCRGDPCSPPWTSWRLSARCI